MLLNTPKIDSIRLLIPYHLIEVNEHHKEFLQEVFTATEQHVLGSKIQRVYRLHSNPCSSHYEQGTSISNNQGEKTLKLGFSSKVLKEDYFNGINASNVDTILDFINNEGVIKINKRTLLQSRIADTDICIDKVLESTTTKEFFSHCHSNSQIHKDTSPNLFQSPTNRGIQWSDRRKVGQAYKTKQYLKFYDKELELLHHSTLFYETYLKHNPFFNLVSGKQVRIETTLKNKAHWETYGIEIKTFEDLLNLDLTKHLEIFKRPINHYMSGNKAIFHRTNLTPADKMILMLVDSLMKLHNINEVSSIEMICNDLFPISIVGTKNARSRHKKKLKNLVLNNKKKDAETYNENQLNIISELEKMELF